MIRERVAAWLLLALLLASSAAAQTYNITDLGVLPGYSTSWGMYINSSGQVTGCSDNWTVQSQICAGYTTAEGYLWNNGAMQDIGALPGDDVVIPYYISDSTGIVGYSGNYDNGTGHGFLWTPSGGMLDLGTLPGGNGFSAADAMTSSGIIAGESANGSGEVHAVLWTKKKGVYQIHDEGILPNAPYTYPYDINNKKQVVGIAYFDQAGTSYHGFLWSAVGGWADLGTLSGGQNSIADWINSKGVIVGSSTSAQYPDGVAVYWDKSLAIHTIGTLPGFTSSYAGFISSKGQVLGESFVSGGPSHAFLWTQKAGFLDLNNLLPPNSGWVLNHASAMNASGQIVGFGVVNGEIHGFLIAP